MSVIENTIVKIHDTNVALPFQLFDDIEYQFGTIEIQMKPNLPIINNPIYLIFNIDVSGSMGDKCIDGRTKMEHIKYTLENMIRLFHKHQETNISIYVQCFDSNVKQIIDTINLHDTEIEEIIRLLKNIYPENLTNIELALQTAQEKIENYHQNNPDSEIIHIFLTDGDITKGSIDNNYLSTLVSQKCKNIFIGYGINHNSVLLSSLSKNKNDEYRFIDALEKAGLVYGEIIHGILYTALKDVILSTEEETEMYNFLTNTWEKRLEIGNLSSEQMKTIHIRSKTQQNIFLSGKTVDENIIIFEATSKCTVDLSIYMFRQKTQELLYEVRKVSEKYKSNIFDYSIPMYNKPSNIQNIEDAEINGVKDKLKEFHKLMMEYKNANNINNPMMEMLCDDIYIAYKTLGTHIGNMYACARQTSNGREQTYVCSEIPEEILCQQNYDIPDDFLDIQTDRDGQNGDNGYNREDNGDIEKYTLSQNHLSPHATNEMLAIMKEISR